MTSIQTLPMITLADLNARAALQTRVDRKYIVPIADASLLVEMLPSGTEVLQIDERRVFGYESTYFDTIDLDSYLGAAHRRRRRFKVRTRRYVDTDATWLEVKTREGRYTVKRRIPYAEPFDVTPVGADFVGQVLDGASVRHIGTDDLVATLHSAYDRTTLCVQERSRLTIDTGLTWSLPGGDPLLSVPHLAIVETKTASAPSSADRLLWSLGIRPTTVSKYGTGMAALNPELPHTVWRRAIRQHVRPMSVAPHLAGDTR